MAEIPYNDKNGRAISVGDLVRYGDVEGEVLVLEKAVPGSRSAKVGLGMIYVEGASFWGGNAVLWADTVEIVAKEAR